MRVERVEQVEEVEMMLGRELGGGGGGGEKRGKVFVGIRDCGS